MQNHSEIVRNVRGRMTRFDSLTPEIVKTAKGGPEMKLWAIPVSCEVIGIAVIPGDSLEDDIYAAKHDDSIELPVGDYVDGSIDVTIDDDDLLREIYNSGQPDEMRFEGGDSGGL